MGNKKVSQLTPLAASEVVADDLFYIVDTSAMESKKITAGDVLTYITTTGSFNAVHAVNADTASYLNTSGRNINISSSTVSITSSYSHLASRAINADTATLADTASYVNLGNVSVGTASYLNYTGIFNGTASYSLTSSVVNLSKTASFLQYTPGVINGTASYAFSSSTSDFASVAETVLNPGVINATTATSASWASSSISSSYSLYSLNGLVNYYNVQSSIIQTGTGGTPSNPFAIDGLEVKLRTTSYFSTFLIILSTVVGNGGAPGQTSVGLWKSSSLETVPLIKTIGNINPGVDETMVLSTTYVDKSLYNPDTALTFSAQVYNSEPGAWFINRDSSNTRYGTSSLVVIEFIS